MKTQRLLILYVAAIVVKRSYRLKKTYLPLAITQLRSQPLGVVFDRRSTRVCSLLLYSQIRP